MRYIVLAFLLLLIPGAAHAGNCSNPVKPEGAIIYNTTYHVAQFCNGTGWKNMSGAAVSAGGVCGAPSGFSFTDLTGQSLSTVITSNTATITFTGCSLGQSVSVTGGGTPQISINGAAWATSGTILSGQTLQVRLTSSGALSTMLTATVTMASSSINWHVTTRAGLNIFLSANSYIGGTLGGLAGADAVCQSEAGATGYPGIYKAIMSDNTTNAASRLTLSYPIVNAFNNSVVAASNLWSGTLNGQILPPSGSTTGRNVWTGSGPTGITTGNTCTNWTDTPGNTGTGASDHTNTQWSNFASSNCTVTAYLYCIQQ